MKITTSPHGAKIYEVRCKEPSATDLQKALIDALNGFLEGPLETEREHANQYGMLERVDWLQKDRYFVMDVRNIIENMKTQGQSERELTEKLVEYLKAGKFNNNPRPFTRRKIIEIVETVGEQE